MMQKIQDMATVLRRDVIEMTTAAGSGHPTTCLSCADVMSVLFFNEMHYDIKDPHNPDNDEFVLSKGHAAPILYAALYRAGAITTNLLTLRKWRSPLEGHPVPAVFPWAKVATGSLGQGLSNAVGMALAARRQKRSFRTYVLLGDSEIAEGSVYEALQLAAHEKLDNLCAIVDVNRLGQSGETMVGHDVASYKERFASFGWNALVIDGHSIAQIRLALARSRQRKGRPTVILAKTYKGKGVSFLENKEGWHGKPLDVDQKKKALAELGDPAVPTFDIKRPKNKPQCLRRRAKIQVRTNYKRGDLVAIREAYGTVLPELASQDGWVIGIDAEVKNSTHAQSLKERHPEQFVEAYIAEQNMVGMAAGLAVKGHNVFTSTFAAFFTRAFDQIRMSALSSAKITFVGSHAGVSIGEDGASQMGLEDLAMFRALPGSIVLYPSDAVSAEKLVGQAYHHTGIAYVRTSRPKTPVIYGNGETFKVGGFKAFKKNKARALVVGAGVTLHEALEAQAILDAEKIPVTVVDCYSVKPFDAKRFASLAKVAGGIVVVAEDHYPEGGIGEMIAASVCDISLTHLAVNRMAHSGPAEKLLRSYGIDAQGIAAAVRKVVRAGKQKTTAKKRAKEKTSKKR